jgi:hypothetical protein
MSIRIRPTNGSTVPPTSTETLNSAAPSTPADNAAATALQALAGGVSQPQQPAGPTTPPQDASKPPPTSPASAPTHVGNWTARLSNGAQVQLNLQADGRFQWIATNKSGQRSTFQGSYTFDNGSLTLVRSNDNQKLSGVVSLAGNQSFTFKLGGAKDNGLNFVRT